MTTKVKKRFNQLFAANKFWLGVILLICVLSIGVHYPTTLTSYDYDDGQRGEVESSAGRRNVRGPVSKNDSSHNRRRQPAKNLTNANAVANATPKSTTTTSTTTTTIATTTRRFNQYLSYNNESDCPFRVEPILWSKKMVEQKQQQRKQNATIAPSATIATLNHPDCNAITDVTNLYATYRVALWKPDTPQDDYGILELVKDCDRLKRSAYFAEAPASEEEADFPLAYVFVGQRNADQTLRLFRAIYWPQNAYCFTYDKKASETYREFMLALAACFPENVVVNPSPLEVNWGYDSVLYNVMACFGPLVESPIMWKYVQVVSYNDFPLKTNLEMVKIMKIMNGSNDCDLLHPITEYYYDYHSYKPYRGPGPKQKPVPPDGLILFKGSYATTMTREFVQFMLDDPVSQELLEWMEGTWCPEEHYWTTLIHNTALKAPGVFPGQCLWFYDYVKSKKPYLSRCQVWQDDPIDGHNCGGKFTKRSCVYGVSDVPWLKGRQEFIGHKFYSEFQPASLYCLEKWHWEKVCSRTTQYITENSKLYKDLPATRYQNTVDKNTFRC